MKSRSPHEYFLSELTPGNRTLILNSPSPDLIHQARARSIHVELLNAAERDFRFFSFKRDSLDAVYFHRWLEHYSRDDLNRILSHLAASLRPGAPIFLESPRDTLPPEQQDPLHALIRQCGFRFEGAFESPESVVWVHRAP